MAMSCVKGGKECTGCMKCEESASIPYRCKCGHIFNANDIYYTSNYDGEIIGCEYCIQENQVNIERVNNYAI